MASAHLFRLVTEYPEGHSVCVWVLQQEKLITRRHICQILYVRLML